MEQYNDNSSILYERLYDSVTGNPIIIPTTEVQECNNHGIITLSLIPNESEGLEFPELNNMHEVYNAEDVVGENDFYCNYKRGDVYLHESKWHKKHKISYKGEGISFIGANRVYTQRDKDGNVVQTLDYIIEKGMEAIESLLIIGSAIQVLYRLEQDIADGNELHTNLQSDISTGEPLNESLKIEVPKAQVIEPRLKEQNVEGNRILPLLTDANEQAVINHSNLQEDVINTGEIVDKIKTTGNASFVIEVGDWTTSDDSNWTYMYTLSTSLHSSDLVFKTQEITTKGFEDCLLYSIVKDANTIAFYTDNNIRIKIVVNARQYGGIIQDFSVVNTDLISEGASNKYVTSQEKINIGTIHNKVDKEEGKGLSTNDYTDSDQSEVAKIKNLLNLTYPVGSIYMSVNNTNPKSLFGGTWEEFAKGKTLIGVDTAQIEFNTVEKNGGEKTHKLTTEEMPIHAPKWNGYSAGNLYTGSGTSVTYALFGNDTWNGSKANGIQPVGGDQPHNNLQPYITCYIWKRIE